MTFINKLIYLKNICCPCFAETQIPETQTQLQKQLIQIKRVNKTQNLQKQHLMRQKSNDVSTSEINFAEVKQQTNKMFRSLKTPNRNSLKLQNKLQTIQNCDILEQNKSDSSFQTVKSNLSRPLSRRQFKVLKTSSLFRSSRQNNQDQFYSINQSDNTSLKNNVFKFGDQFAADQSELMANWIKKQYQKLQGQTKVQINQIMKLKIQGKDNFDSIVHKIQDYYTFYYNDDQQTSNLTQSQIYIGKNNCFIGSFNKTQSNKTFDNQKSCKYMALCVIQHISISPIKFLQWFNQRQIQGVFHNFNRIQYMQLNQIEEEFPILVVEQFDQQLAGKTKLTLIKQIQSVKFENQSQESLLQVDYQISDSTKYFQRLIRVDCLQNAKVQIYTQSSQNIKGSQEKYFKQRWLQFEERLYKDKIIKSQYKYYVN